MRRKINKRFIAGFLTILIIFTTVFSGFTPLMGIHAANRFRGTNIWTGDSEVMFGKNRNYMYRWTDGYQMTFCIDPGKHMSREVNESATRCHINDDNVPYIQSKEDFKRLALICDWFDTRAGSIRASNASYAAAQGAIWAIVMEHWDSADSIIKIINKHIPGTTSKWQELKTYVNSATSGSSELPKWCAMTERQVPQLNMTLINGEYKIDLDITGYPELDGVLWELPDNNWSKKIIGNTLSIVYKGTAELRDVLIVGKAPESMSGLAKNSEFLVVYSPEDTKDQAMIGSGAQPAELQLYIKLRRVILPQPGSGPTLEIFEHKETFESNYNIDIKKYCAETGQTLQGATFTILEAFDAAQVRRPLSLSNMTPKPTSWDGFKECAQIQTDETGHASHKDTKYYKYNKTYCGGHPDPKYLEIPEEKIDLDTEEVTNTDEIAVAEAENERLRAEWKALVELCEEETDFHSVEEGEALDWMIEDRDDTYEQFIGLNYDYTVTEVDARYGYILHGQHDDDDEIPVVRISSSESGANLEEVATTVTERERDTSDHPAFDLISEHDKDINVSLPEPEEDEEPAITPWRSRTKNAYTFQVSDCRTEGEIHINKRDLELYHNDTSRDKEESFGQAQGDATLEGAVYGLYAAADLVHPDGKTGKVFSANDLVAIATTNYNGNASFLVITEESKSSLAVNNLDGTWIGHPLLLGNYYIKEISRSEGYELSVHGINLTESNRLGTRGEVLTPVGSASAGRLEHPVDNHDGSWNEFEVRNFKTENGFDIVISGYPKGTTFFTSKLKEHTTTENVVIGTVRIPTGEFEKAVEGEKKLDPSGNYIPVLDSDGNPLHDQSTPLANTYFTYYRLNVYPSGTATPEIDLEKWEDSTTVDPDYIQQEVNAMLHQKGFRLLDDVHGDGAPWTILELAGTTNQEIAEEILEWYQVHEFWDSAAVHRVFEKGGNYKAAIFYDYQAVISTSIYDPLDQSVYVRKNITVTGGAGSSHMFIRYPSCDITRKGFYATVSPIKEVSTEVAFLDRMEDCLEEQYQPLYETYDEGELRLDRNGWPIEIYQTEFIYGNEEQTITDYELVPVVAEYDATAGTYTVHVENTTDWTGVTDSQVTTYRAVTTEKRIMVDGEEMFYADYLTQVAGAGVTAYASIDALDTGSYICFQNLVYPGQIPVFQDGGTRVRPVRVLQRVIKQAIKVIKDISEDSYKEKNTYRIHRDPFTILFGGFWGTGKKFVPGFKFKLYRVAELEATGLLEKNKDGSNNYKKFFSDKGNSQLFQNLAISWDKPERDIDSDLTTLHAVLGNGKEAYYGESVMLPYGTYVMVEQISTELVNKHYELDGPKEVEIPFVPEMNPDGTATDQPSKEYLYFADYTPEELMNKFQIRFHKETHVIRAHNHDGDFEVYKYGLDHGGKPEPYGNPDVAAYYQWDSTSESAGTTDQVYYKVRYDKNGNVTGYGEQQNGVLTMTGKSTAINGKYAKALVPWSVLDPRTGAIIDDKGNVGNRRPGLDEEGGFNFISFNNTHFENTLYSSKLRVEKLDRETGENIIHDGALFKIYAASRDVTGVGATGVTGTGNVQYITEDVSGTRSELEARGDVDGIAWNAAAGIYTGTVTKPVYHENEFITMIDRTGGKVGVFQACSTEREVVKRDGTISKEKIGYIETYQPLGSGAYVLVEVQAPDGYQKSKPIPFEVYKDKVTYYEQGDPDCQAEAERYQYVKPLNETDELHYEDVAQIKVIDSPSKLYVHKVESGDGKVGDENALDGLRNVNDKGDLLTYVVRGHKKYLEARGDVDNIAWDAEKREYAGTVTKTFQEWSESIIAGTEIDLLAMENVKPLYEMKTEAFTGFGIRFGIHVSGAELTLLKGLAVQRTATGYQGIKVDWEDGKVINISAGDTGNHLEITTNKRDSRPPYLDIWDTERIQNKPVKVFFYNMDSAQTARDGRTGETWILDDRGNRICLADPVTGMAYAYDDYGTMIVYEADELGDKVVAKSIETHNDGKKDYIYINGNMEEDELGFPLYYNSGEVTYQNEIWVSDGTPHEITRLPFGAYILEESQVPYNQGYTKAPDQAFILRESSEDQHYYFQNEFTKINVAKIDITTKDEIPDAGMTLYRAERIPDESKKGYHLERGEAYANWISGYQYDDHGSLKLNREDEKIATSKPHWIDHIPYGYYILEESRVPYEWGYVQSDLVEIYISETGNVQTFVMEDDYTSVELKKLDANTGVVLDNTHKATLGLYQASLDPEGNPILKEAGDMLGKTIPVYDPDSRIISWETGDGLDVAATGRQITDEYGMTRTVYDYDIQYVPITTEIRQARYYITERGTTMFEYLPVGQYVLVEENAPVGYATALPVLITVEDTKIQDSVQHYEMHDIPLALEVSKSDVAGAGKEVYGAQMSVYSFIEGEKADLPVYSWISGSDGRFTKADQTNGTIPLGYQEGDIRPHRITYIPAGDYILAEETTPYGFLRAEELPFTVMDTRETQEIQIVDRIPDGKLKVVKHDSKDAALLLSGAVFRMTNQTLDQEMETVITGDNGIAEFAPVPIGYMDMEGNFRPYTYLLTEISAPRDYMLNPIPYEFQFQYVDDKTTIIRREYQAKDQLNQVKISKKILTNQEDLPGAQMMVVGRYTKNVVDQWISTCQPHYINGIVAGEYTLIETATPGGGYAMAERINFTIIDNMIKTPFIVMYDKPTETEIQKTDGNSNRLLPGAKMQLCSADGNILYEWVTTNVPYTVYGLEPGTYLLKELEAPIGYVPGRPMQIKVENSFEVQKFKYVNHKKFSGEKGKQPDGEWVFLRKYSGNGEILPGAVFTCYRPDGSVLTTVESDSQGFLRILTPGPGTYLMKEMKAPQGYFKGEGVFWFTVKEDRSVIGDYRIVNTPAPQIGLVKKDGETAGLLSGAVLQVFHESGNIVVEGITNEMGRFYFTAPSPGTYVVKEIKAPEGYEKSDRECFFTVAADGSVIGNTVIYNYKLHSRTKIGMITAFYSSSNGGNRIPESGSQDRYVPGAKTGDETGYEIYLVLGHSLAVIFFAMALWLGVKAHRKGGTK